MCADTFEDSYQHAFPFPPNGKGLGKPKRIAWTSFSNGEMFRFPPNGKGLGKYGIET